MRQSRKDEGERRQMHEALSKISAIRTSAISN